MAVNYKLIEGGVVKLPDYASIAENGAGWQEYVDWVALGNTALPADVPTPEQTAKALEMSEAQSIAKAFYDANPAIASFIRDKTTAQRKAEINAMTLAQLRTVVSYLVEAVIMDIKRELL